MKHLVMTLSVLAFVLTMLVACGGDATTTTDTNETEQTDKKEGPEYTSAYICPMHCEGSGSEEPGKCPACGMDYEKNEKHNHAHEH